MKYKDFYQYLTIKINKEDACIGPSICIKLDDNSPSGRGNYRSLVSTTEDSFDFNVGVNVKFIIFPIKIYGETIRHLNILILDRKTKIIERYEPFNRYLKHKVIDGLIEQVLYNWMSRGKIYFLKYQTTLNSEPVLNDKNCGIHCINYVMSKLSKGSLSSGREESPGGHSR